MYNTNIMICFYIYKYITKFNNGALGHPRTERFMFFYCVLVFFKFLKIDKELNDMLIIEGIVDLNVDILG